MCHRWHQSLLYKRSKICYLHYVQIRFCRFLLMQSCTTKILFRCSGLTLSNFLTNATLPIQAPNYSPILWTLNCHSLLHILKASLWIRVTVHFLMLPCLRSFTRRTSGYHLGTFGTVQFCLSFNKHGVYHYNPHFLLLLIPNSHSFLWIHCLKR